MYTRDKRTKKHKKKEKSFALARDVCKSRVEPQQWSQDSGETLGKLPGRDLSRNEQHSDLTGSERFIIILSFAVRTSSNNRDYAISLKMNNKVNI